MIGFNALLRDEGIDPKDVKLVRHIDKRQEKKTQPYDLWKAADGTFEDYQKIQRREVFRGVPWIAAFVVTPLNETLFAAMYENKGASTAKRGTHDPLSKKDVGGYHLYELIQSPKLAEYAGRLIIDWGQGYRRWDQLANKQDKAILEIRRTAADPPFPGFINFRARLETLRSVPVSWRTALSAVKGIYLLANPDTGLQYVGSAQGGEGFWGRWEEYVASGHGGNRRMRDVPAADYQVSVLEVASSSAGPEEIARMETCWKEKLMSRKFGLNANG